MSTRGFVGFKYNGKIKGHYNHSDSYPEGLGFDLLNTLYCRHPWEVIKDFFLNRATYVEDDEYYAKHKSFFELDFAKDKVTLQDGNEFYKNGLYCEYSYIFDLDSPTKKLLLFKGFGKKPAKGYEDWFYESDGDKERLYMIPCGCLEGDLPEVVARALMQVKFAKDRKRGEDSDEYCNEMDALELVLTAPSKKIPTLAGRFKSVDEVITWRLTNESVARKRSGRKSGQTPQLALSGSQHASIFGAF